LLLQRLEAGEFEGQPVFVFIDDGGELGEARVASQLEQLVRIARDGSLRVIAATETSAARGLGIGWIRELRKEGHGLLLQPDLAADADILSARLPRRTTAPSTPGRGFLVSRGVAELVQVAS
jgi:S-DNA-T family DNA segregation ATPase FtsK/SpoIIIE